MSDRAQWKVHTSSLLQEILNNPGTEILTQPLRIFGHLLAAVAERAAEIDDPELNILMLRLTLYEQADPEKFSAQQISAEFSNQEKRVPRTPAVPSQEGKRR